MNKQIVSICALVSMALVACASSPGPASAANAPDNPPLAEMAPPDEKVQKGKARDDRLTIGMEALRTNDLDRARRHITRALKIDPKSAEAHNAMALYYRAEGDDKHEEKEFRKAISLNSKYSQARNNYAALLYRKGRFKEAISQLEKAAEDTTYDQRQMIFLNLGRSYLQAKRYDEAIDALQRTLRLDSLQSDAYLDLADAYFAQGKTADANTYYTAFAQNSRQTARSLWLGIRIVAAGGGDADKLSSYEFELVQMYKDSPERALWSAWKAGTATPTAASDKSGAR